MGGSSRGTQSSELKCHKPRITCSKASSSASRDPQVRARSLFRLGVARSGSPLATALPSPILTLPNHSSARAHSRRTQRLRPTAQGSGCHARWQSRVSLVLHLSARTEWPTSPAHTFTDSTPLGRASGGFPTHPSLTWSRPMVWLDPRSRSVLGAPSSPRAGWSGPSGSPTRSKRAGASRKPGMRSTRTP